MKKIILAALLAVCGVGSASAQTSKGSIVISGNISLYIDNYEEIRFDNHKDERNIAGIRIFPAIGYLIADNTEVGVGVNPYYNRFKSKSKYDDFPETTFTEKNFGTSLSTYLRKYLPLTDKLFLDGTGYGLAGVGRTTVQPGPDQPERKVTHFGVGVRPGLSYFVTERFGLTTNFGDLSYNWNRTKTGTGPKTTDKNFRADLSLSAFSFGLRYFISR